jgi:hypothetical protein
MWRDRSTKDMRRPAHAGHQLDIVLTRLEREQLIDLPLDDLGDLVREPDVDPRVPRRSPDRAGVDDIALTLAAAERLPAQLTVRVVIPAESSSAISIEEAQAALRRRAASLASEAWREAMAIRSMGRAQLPRGIGIGLGAALVAYLAAYLAAVVETAAARGGLVVLAAIALTIAWVVGWVVVEAFILDWRLPSRKASAYELLAHATLQVVVEDAPPTSDTPSQTGG